VASAGGIKAMAVYGTTVPVLFLGVSKTAPTGAELRSYNGASVSSLLYSLQEPDCLTMCVFEDRLWLFGADTAGVRGGIYRTDGTNYDRVEDLPYNYARCSAVFGRLLYLGMGRLGDLLSWDGDASAVVASGLNGASTELRGIAVWGNALWLACRDDSEVRLRRYDPARGSWSIPAQGGSVDANANGVQSLAVYSDDLYVSGGKAGSAAPIYKLTSSAYPTAAKTLETVLFAAGLGQDQKVWRSVTVNHAALAASESIEVQYQLDDAGSWTSLGTSDTDGATSKTLSFGSAITSRLIGLRLLLTGTASSTPVLYEVLLKYAPQPELKREWQFDALYEGSDDLPLVLLDGTHSADTGAEIEAAIWTQKAVKAPITLVDQDTVSYSVWFLEHEVKMSERSQRRGEQTRGRIRLREA
jgi:hypothetical protein